MGFPDSSTGKESACNAAGVLSSIPMSGRSPGKGNSNPLQYSCLENSMDRGVRYSPQDSRESDSTERLSFSPVHIKFYFKL